MGRGKIRIHPDGLIIGFDGVFKFPSDGKVKSFFAQFFGQSGGSLLISQAHSDRVFNVSFCFKSAIPFPETGKLRFCPFTA